MNSFVIFISNISIIHMYRVTIGNLNFFYKSFFVFQLSFRSAVSTAEKIREQIRRVLQLPPTRSSSQSSSNSFSTLTTIKNKKHVQLNTIKEDVEALDINTAIEVESSINTYLRRSSETFDLTKNYEVKLVSQNDR